MENRRTRRFKLQLPVAITRSGAERVAFAGLTANISSSGVLFTSEREPDLGGPIEYIITLNHEGAQAVNLRCMGKVLRAIRLEREQSDVGFQVAATLERYEFVRERGRPAGL
jgi:PilZ domain